MSRRSLCPDGAVLRSYSTADVSARAFETTAGSRGLSKSREDERLAKAVGTQQIAVVMPRRNQTMASKLGSPRFVCGFL